MTMPFHTSKLVDRVITAGMTADERRSYRKAQAATNRLALAIAKDALKIMSADGTAKRCSTCNDFRPLDEFAPDFHDFTGMAPSCRRCTAPQHKE